MSDDLHSLISTACDNRATEAELTQLARMLRDDPETRDEYLRYVDIHSALADEALHDDVMGHISERVEGSRR